RLAGQHPRAAQRGRTGDAARRRRPAHRRSFPRGDERWRAADRGGGAAGVRHRPRTAGTLPGRPGAGTERLEPDARRRAARLESRSDPLPDRKIQARKARCHLEPSRKNLTPAVLATAARRLTARGVLPPSACVAAGYGARAPGTSRPEGRWTWHALATDGNRVRKRSGHAAPDSTMALGSAVSRDDSWAVGGITPGGVRVVSTGAGGHGCHASRPSAHGRDVPGAISRIARSSRRARDGGLEDGLRAG